jgi:hypothetical protein
MTKLEKRNANRIYQSSKKYLEWRKKYLIDKKTEYKGAWYYTLHNWVKRKLGKPMKCEICGSTNAKKYEWANKSHKYKRELNDWVRLCVPCHKQFDGRALNLTTK